MTPVFERHARSGTRRGRGGDLVGRAILHRFDSLLQAAIDADPRESEPMLRAMKLLASNPGRFRRPTVPSQHRPDRIASLAGAWVTWTITARSPAMLRQLAAVGLFPEDRVPGTADASHQWATELLLTSAGADLTPGEVHGEWAAAVIQQLHTFTQAGVPVDLRNLSDLMRTALNTVVLSTWAHTAAHRSDHDADPLIIILGREHYDGLHSDLGENAEPLCALLDRDSWAEIIEAAQRALIDSTERMRAQAKQHAFVTLRRRMKPARRTFLWSS